VPSPNPAPGNPHPAPVGRPGFTLLELMLAFTLLAIIAGGMTLALSTSLRAVDTIRGRGEAADERRALVARLRADLEGVWLRPGSQTTWFRGGDLTGTASTSTSARGDLLELTTTRLLSSEVLTSEGDAGSVANPRDLANDEPQSDVAQVTWQLEPDRDGRLSLVRRERVPPDPEIEQTQSVDPSVVSVVYAREVSDLNVRFFDGTDWLETWDTVVSEETSEEESAQPGALPMAVEVTISFGDEAAVASVDRRRGSRSPKVAATAPLTLVVALPAETQAAVAAGGTDGVP
jgi:prepilin-type N-terminal cleavage/methylation domain-containing protein